MNKPLSFKLGMIVLLMLLLLIPLLMISGLIDERQAVRDGVLQDIAQSSRQHILCQLHRPFARPAGVRVGRVVVVLERHFQGQ
ncbi:MAG: hypothetical protein GAK45_02491 [Pseudomonas citronellolis]|nr:MAG: hypothetical protein GAK45_02491 [Pseudomonas citronellolis]